jgi:hypothetical protein
MNEERFGKCMLKYKLSVKMLTFTANTLCKGIINKKYSKSTKHPKSSQTQSQTNYGAQLVPS